MSIDYKLAKNTAKVKFEKTAQKLSAATPPFAKGGAFLQFHFQTKTKNTTPARF